MKPSELVLRLRRIAAAIDNSKQPHKHLVASDLKKLLARMAGQCWRCHKEVPDEELDGNRGDVCNWCTKKLEWKGYEPPPDSYTAAVPCLECGARTDNIDNVCDNCLGRGR